MQITPMCKALALHEIFDSNAVEPGGALSREVLADAWQSTGLRQADLDDALADLRSRGEFEVFDEPDGTLVVLTEAGFRQAQRDLSDLAEIEALIRAYATLALLRRRRPQGAGGGRRRSDRYA
jgi:hypothetical protein